ncbi:MAG: hypothetical protein ABI618_15660 [Nitrospirota bacterium]
MSRRTENVPPSPSPKLNHQFSPLDAVQLLTQDHRKVELLFKELVTVPSTRQAEVAQDIFLELAIHASLEEELFYPALRSEGDLIEVDSLQEGETEINGANIVAQAETMDDNEEQAAAEGVEGGEETIEDVIDIAYEDHRAVKTLVAKLKILHPTNPEFLTGMEELKDLVMEHVAEEEEVLFADATLNLDTKTLGEQMQARKQDLMSSIAP